MKLASLKAGGRDGTLIVVNKDLTKAVGVQDIAPTMQAALDNWEKVSPKLQAVYEKLNSDGISNAFDLAFEALAAPLPRAYQWLDGSAYVTHVELVRKARGVEMPEKFWTDPLMYQGGSDMMMGCRDPIEAGSESYGIDFESEIAVITDDVPMGCTDTDAAHHIKLVMLVNDVSLRGLIPEELKKGFGFIHGKPATAFSPVAVTPDELGRSWKEEKLHLPLRTTLNDQIFGTPNAGIDMTFSFGELVAHAAHTRHLSAGTIIGSGTISNADRTVGSSCLAEKRMIETIEGGSPQTPFMRYGDRVKIEMLDEGGQSIFGSIEQQVVPYEYKGLSKAQGF